MVNANFWPFWDCVRGNKRGARAIADGTIVATLGAMTKDTGRKVLLAAFDRLFERAVTKLALDCSQEEKDEAKQYFVDHYEQALEVLDAAEFPAIPDSALEGMELAIDRVPPGRIAGYLAAGPLGKHVQDFIQRLAIQAAEQRLIEQLAQRADDTYGGN